MRTKILIVEDDPVQADFLAAQLQSRGCFVDIVSTGMEAVQRIMLDLFEVVLMDLHIPDLDGLTVARVIEGFDRLTTRPIVIALTVSAASLARSAGASGFQFDAIERKPVSLDRLMATIGACRMAAAVRGAAPSVRADLPRHVLGRFAGSEANGAGGRILLIDDDVELCRYLAGVLAAKGYVLSVAHDGFAALRLLSRQSFDVAIVDYQLPTLNGAEMGRLVHALINRTDRPRLVGLTALPELLKRHDSATVKLFDKIVPKAKGTPALLTAIRKCLDYQQHKKQVVDTHIIALEDMAKLALPAEPI